jgi:8-oxo-dGTP pyrophosphatase MutT (NUDIX family)
MIKKNYCSNCGIYGHLYKSCPEPNISLGILGIYINKEILNDIYKNVDKLKDINYNYKRLSNLSKINYYKDKIKFLLIEKKHSLNYLEFIRGLYDVNDKEKLIKIFSLMSKKEIENIKNHNFEYLWNDLWKSTAKKIEYKKEFLESKNKFNILKNNDMLDILINKGSIYNTPEWEIPKGRRNLYETNLECAKREFKEETGYIENDYEILNNLYCINNNFIGTNGKEYKYIYYIGLLKNINNTTDIRNKEVGNISLLNWDEAISKIRPYDKSKIDVINEIFLLFLNLAEENNNQIVKDI